MLIALAALASWFRRRPPPPEAAAFRELRRACRGADAKITYRAWQAWNTQRSGRSIPPELALAVATLERSLFSSSGSWRPEDSHSLLDSIRTARNLRRDHATTNALPPLNPAPSDKGVETHRPNM